jgi:hypothetical protein
MPPLMTVSFILLQSLLQFTLHLFQFRDTIVAGLNLHLLGIVLNSKVALMTLQAFLQLLFQSVHHCFLVCALSSQGLNLVGKLLGMIFQSLVFLTQLAIFFLQEFFSLHERPSLHLQFAQTPSG